MEGVFNQPDFAPCPACGVPLLTEVFPALFRKTTAGQSAQAVMVEGESSCFYHAEKKAVLPCDACGRFLCALCDCLVHGSHYCPACLEAGKTKGKIKSLEIQRTHYDNIALSLVILPVAFLVTVIFSPFSVIGLGTAPAAIFVAIRYWNAPQSIVGRSRIRFVIAILIALLEIAGWIILFIYIFLAPHHGIHARY